MFILSTHGSVVQPLSCSSVLLVHPGLMVQSQLCEEANSVLVLWIPSPCLVDELAGCVCLCP